MLSSFMKRLVAVVLAVALMFAVPATASAQTTTDPNTGAVGTTDMDDAGDEDGFDDWGLLGLLGLAGLLGAKRREPDRSTYTSTHTTGGADTSGTRRP